MSEGSFLTCSDYLGAVVEILNRYSFDVQQDFWFSGGLLNVYGVCRREELCSSAAVAVEVNCYSDLRRCIDRVRKSGATYKFVVLTKPLGMALAKHQDVFVIRDLQEFEDVLKSVLKVSDGYQRVAPMVIDEVVKQRCGDLDKYFDGFGVPNDLRTRARKLLLHAYTTCYVLYRDREDAYGRHLGEEAVGNEVAYNILSQLGLVTLVRNSRHRCKRVELVNMCVASVEAEKHIEYIVNDLKKLINECGWEAALLAAIEEVFFERLSSFD